MGPTAGRDRATPSGLHQRSRTEEMSDISRPLVSRAIQEKGGDDGKRVVAAMKEKEGGGVEVKEGKYLVSEEAYWGIQSKLCLIARRLLHRGRIGTYSSGSAVCSTYVVGREPILRTYSPGMRRSVW